MTYNLNKNIL